jgi:hypothetical protein
MKMLITILALLIVSFSTVRVGHSTLDEEYYRYKFSSEDIDDRNEVLHRLNQDLKDKKIILTDELKKICYERVAEIFENKIALPADDEDDGAPNYAGEIYELMTNINDEKMLPLLFQRGQDYPSIDAILVHGEEGFKEAFKYFTKFDNTNDAFKRGFIELLIEFVKPKEKGFTARGKARDEIKQFIIREIKNTAYASQDGNDGYLAGGMKIMIDYEKLPMLEFLLVLGDEDVIPVVEDLAKNDPGYIEVFPDTLKQRKENQENRPTPMRKIRKFKTPADKVKAANEAGHSIKYYPIREKAQLVLEKLKKNNQNETEIPNANIPNSFDDGLTITNVKTGEEEQTEYSHGYVTFSQ